MNNSVVNLAQVFQLSPAQFQLLDRELSFVPSFLVRPFDRGAVLADLGNFHKRMKRAVFFGPTSDSSQARPFCARSHWVPPPQALPGEIFDFFYLNFESVHEVAKRAQAPPPNLSANEIKALGELSHRRDIVIKPADKGSAVVIMDRPEYVQEGLRQLGDVNFYSKLQAPIFQDTIPQIQQIVLDLVQEGFICQ